MRAMTRAPFALAPLTVLAIATAAPAQDPAAVYQQQPKQSFRFAGDTLARYEWTRGIPVTSAGEPIAFVIGGGELYAAALPLAAGLVLTEIQRDFEGDARFPDYDRAKWRETQRESHTAADGMRFDFVLYEPAV